MHIYRGVKAEQPVLHFILFLTSELIISVMKHKAMLCSALTMINMVFSGFGHFFVWSLVLREKEQLKLLPAFPSDAVGSLFVCHHHLVRMELLGKITSLKMQSAASFEEKWHTVDICCSVFAFPGSFRKDNFFSCCSYSWHVCWIWMAMLSNMANAASDIQKSDESVTRVCKVSALNYFKVHWY